MLTDRELLQRYARDASDDAFAELVRRHVALVYGAALRQLCGHTALAADVTQAVFTALAAQRTQAHRIDHLTGWLHGTTRHTVSHTVRAERRRQEREQQAHTMHALLHACGSAEPALPPELVDEVLAQLDAADREAVLRRFFEGQSFAALGAALSLSEDAARMRVTRALEKLRALFARRGIHSTAAALGAALTSHVVAAPPQLAAGILASCAALAATTTAPLVTVTLMSTTKLALSLTGTAAVLALGVAGHQTHRTPPLAAELAQLQADQTRLTAALAASEQKAAALARRSADAETRVAELQGKLSAAATPVTAAPRLIVPSASPEDETRRLNREKMARLKPLLAAGRPITGAVVVLVDGKPVSRPVEFVMDREVRIAEVDDGTYLITPTLNADGSVQYRMTVTRKDPATGSEQLISLPRVTQTPWGGFTVSTGGGRVFAFDPDKLDL